MLAERGEPFTKPGWLFEIKYDGYRLIAAKQRRRHAPLVARGTRSQRHLPRDRDGRSARCPSSTSCSTARSSCTTRAGLPSFARLQKRGRLTRRHDIARAALALPATYYAFDLLGFGDYDLRGLPLHARKDVLEQALPTVGPVRYSEHVEEQGEAMYEHMRKLGLEGVLAKRADSKYVSGPLAPTGSRSPSRRPTTSSSSAGRIRRARRSASARCCSRSTRATRSPHGPRGQRVLDERSRPRCAQRLDALPKPAKPPPRAPAEAGAHWVEPDFVVEVRFKESHARRAAAPAGVPAPARRQAARGMRAAQRRRRRCPSARRRCRRRRRAPSKHIHFTNLDKVFWPGEGYTKGDLIDYYRAVSQLAAALSRRPPARD